MIAAASHFRASASFARQPALRSQRLCRRGLSANAVCASATGRRACLERLRLAALADTTRFLNARLAR